MWPNSQFPASLVTFTEEILNGKLPKIYEEASFESLTILPFIRKCFSRAVKN